MIDAAKAVEIAEESIHRVVPAFAGLAPHVEEIQRSKDGESWIVTFRADNPNPQSEKRSFSEIFFSYIEKVVRIKMDSGDLLSVMNPSYD